MLGCIIFFIVAYCFSVTVHRSKAKIEVLEATVKVLQEDVRRLEKVVGLNND